MRRRVEVRWTRRLDGGPCQESVQVRRDDGDWEEVAADKDLPPDIQELLRLAEEARDASVWNIDRVCRPGGASPTRVSEPNGEELEIQSTWRSPWVILCAIAVAALAYYGWRGLEAAHWLPWLSGAFCAVVGVVLLYYGLALYFNRTTFRIRGGRLTVRHAPIPWFGNCDLPTRAIDQLYVRFRRGSKGGSHYELWASAQGRPVRLYEQGRSRDEVMSIERAIERHLGIQDWPGWNAP